MMTSQLWLQHPVEPVVNDYAILLQLHIVGAKVRLSERKTKFIWIFPSGSTFDEAKDTKKACKSEAILED